MNRYIFLLIFSFFAAFSIKLDAQTLKSYLVAAEKSFEEKDYGSALQYYLAANEFVDDNADLLYKSAESARMFKAYNLAETKLELLDEKQPDNQYSLLTFWLGDIKQRLGKYSEAIDQYKIFLSEHQGENDYFDKRANKEIAACEWASELIFNPSENIKISRLEGDVNSPYSDFGALEENDKFYFSSMRFTRKVDSHYPNRLISKVMKSENGESVIADSIFSDDRLLDAHLSFNSSKTRAYYTICDYTGTAQINCQIYSVEVNPDGSFGKSEKLPDFINEVNFTSTQPNIGYSKNFNKDVLYFVSDREGGKGKMDIWYSIIDKNGSYTRPQNISNINTAEDDITPNFHSPTNTLYFSSNGYLSMGGYDIFASHIETAEFETPIHQGYPMNSSYDDIYFWLSQDGKKAYFSSNREGALYLDPTTEACCYDIFKADIEPIKIDLLVYTFNKKSRAELPGTEIKLYDALTNELAAVVINETTNESKFNLINNRNYYIVASKLGYVSDTTRFNTYGITKTDTIIKKLYLQPMDLSLKVLTYDRTTLNDLNGVEIILENLTDNTVNKIIVTNELGNEFNFDIIRGNKYKITASRKGYESVSELVNTDNYGGTVIIQKLYLADLLNAYLPLIVYFDNDRPDPRSKSKVTSRTYSETYSQYIIRRDEFVQKYNKDVTDENDKEFSRIKIEEFFNKDIKEGKEKFDLFFSTLLAVLQAGHKVDIQFKGYASPRADYDYNLILANRRVKSLDNEIRSFRKGAFTKYIKKGQLKITDVSYGESLASKDISDDLLNDKMSIYSVGASKERRVEVVKISSDLIENK
ncbi:MAG: PD40 domain-containing protein [Saprospiraceae bacterium]|nr:PD40 domain-containing protein [Saprospiraceae bacterium]